VRPLSPTLTISAWSGANLATVADVTGAVGAAAEAGFDGVWVPQTMTVDALTALAVAASTVPTISIGTAVVPIQGRHPVPLAQQATTVADAAGPGRFTLGVGVTHAVVSETFYGFPYRDAVALCREELEALAGLLGPDRHADLVGQHVTTHATLSSAGPSPRVVVAALGPKMLDLAGSLTDGTVTWMTGPVTLRETVVPTITAAASRAGRDVPRVIAGLPVCVTDNPGAARDAVRPRIEAAGRMPSYRRQLGAEGLEDVADLAIVGDASTVVARVQALAEMGVTELMADVFGTGDEPEETRRVLTGLGRRGGAP
jgi:5,10-methylenetetrahydromethanopterin reductase